MTKSFSIFLLAVSLPLCAAATTLWVRSYWIEDYFDRGRGNNVADEAYSCRGRVTIALGVFGVLPRQSRWLTWPAVQDTGALRPFDFAYDNASGAAMLTFPHWSLVLPLVAMTLLVIRIRGRSLTGDVCAVCSHPLRVSMDQCPECGTLVSIGGRKRKMQRTWA